ncbi:MAG: hypothetical protein ACFCVB_21215 [Nodosilinea sp.]
MPQLTQGLIVAVLIGLLLAVIVGYYLRQGQVNDLTEALRQSQTRQEDLEQEHERRLREATQQLQKDYEAQLAESIERHQAQLDEQLGQLEAEYQARQGLVGSAAVETDSSVDQRIRKQYETRLKEVAGKMQQAYEQHLQERLAEERAIAQQAYDRRLAEVIARYQDQASLAQSPTDIPLGNLVPERPVASDTAELEARLQAEYDQRLTERIAQYQDDMAERSAQLEQEYEARLAMATGRTPGSVDGAPEQPSIAELELNLRRELEESLRVEYEQKLAEKIEHYQDELNQRSQELEQSYEARLQLFQSGAPAEAAPSMPDGAELDLEGAIAAANAAALAASIEASLDEASLDTDDVSLDSPEVSLDLDAFSPETGSSIADSAANSDDFGLDLLDSDMESGGGQSFGQDDGLGLDTDFDTEDLEGLLNAPGPDFAADDLLDSLDDISDLS